VKNIEFYIITIFIFYVLLRTIYIIIGFNYNVFIESFNLNKLIIDLGINVCIMLVPFILKYIVKLK
jgi:hypothetical protein